MFHVKYFSTFCSIIFFMVKFSERLKEMRLAKGWTRIQLAEQLGVSLRSISYWETGQRECDFSTLLKLAKLLDCTTDYLLGATDY